MSFRKDGGKGRSFFGDDFNVKAQLAESESGESPKAEDRARPIEKFRVLWKNFEKLFTTTLTTEAHEWATQFQAFNPASLPRDVKLNEIAHSFSTLANNATTSDLDKFLLDLNSLKEKLEFFASRSESGKEPLEWIKNVYAWFTAQKILYDRLLSSIGPTREQTLETLSNYADKDDHLNSISLTLDELSESKSIHAIHSNLDLLLENVDAAQSEGLECKPLYKWLRDKMTTIPRLANAGMPLIADCGSNPPTFHANHKPHKPKRDL